LSKFDQVYEKTEGVASYPVIVYACISLKFIMIKLSTCFPRSNQNGNYCKNFNYIMHSCI